MAINSKQALSLTGVDLRNKTRKEISEIVSVLASAGNKRIVRLEQAGQPIQKTVKKFSVAGKTRNQLLKEFTRVKNFMNSETDSLSGQRILARNVSRGITERAFGKTEAELKHGEKTKFKKTMQNYKKVLSGSYRGTRNRTTFWRAYERLKERRPALANLGYKYKLLEKQAEIMKNAPSISTGRLADKMIEVFDKMYEQEQEDIKNASNSVGDGLKFNRPQSE